MLSFGAAGVTILALAGILAATGIFLSQIRSLGVLTTYDARTRLYLGIAAWNLALPLIVSAVIGALVAAFLGTLALQICRTGVISPYQCCRQCCSASPLSPLLTLLCGTTAGRAVRTWHPSKENGWCEPRDSGSPETAMAAAARRPAAQPRSTPTAGALGHRAEWLNHYRRSDGGYALP